LEKKNVFPKKYVELRTFDGIFPASSGTDRQNNIIPESSGIERQNNPPASSGPKNRKKTFRILKVPSHQIRLCLKCYGWIGLDEYKDRGWYKDFLMLPLFFILI
jgi:hypothetical protein